MHALAVVEWYSKKIHILHTIKEILAREFDIKTVASSSNHLELGLRTNQVINMRPALLRLGTYYYFSDLASSFALAARLMNSAL